MLKVLNEYIAGNVSLPDLDAGVFFLRESDRPDLSDFQANGAFQAARLVRRNPREIAEDIASALRGLGLFGDVFVSGPGFVNVKVGDEFILETLSKYTPTPVKLERTERLILDYGGPNVAKPLHVGHLRSAVIGQALKGIARHLGNTVIADIHLGDWGTPMGMLIAYLREKHPQWPYFSGSLLNDSIGFSLPITVEELNNLYPQASNLFKQDPGFAERARDATAALQSGHAGYVALWKALVDVSVNSVRADFNRLGVDFDLWDGESDAESVMPDLLRHLERVGVTLISDGALVVDVSVGHDKFSVPPLIVKKRDSAVTYGATDMATIMSRVNTIDPDRILYVVDNRQSLHFTQVFRATEKAGLAKAEQLEHVGFGTVNGSDGKPFKTREGGVMRLAQLLDLVEKAVADDGNFSWPTGDDQLDEMIRMIALAAVKFGDLANIRTSDYIFDVEAFTRIEGKTGPYLQYTATRAASLLKKASFDAHSAGPVRLIDKDGRTLAMTVLKFQSALELAYAKRMPSILCDFAYELANSFNSFYHNCPILSEASEELRSSRLVLVHFANCALRASLSCLGIPIPAKMLRSPLAERRL